MSRKIPHTLDRCSQVDHRYSLIFCRKKVGAEKDGAGTISS